MRKMRTVVILLLVILLFVEIGCNSSAYSDESAIGESRNDSIGYSINADIHGVWILKDYIEDVVKSKSPFYSSRLLTGLVCIVIDTSKLNGDSLTVAASLNNHEGDVFTIYFDKNKRSGFLKTSIQDYDNPDNATGVIIDKNENILKIVVCNLNGDTVSERHYIKVIEEPTGDDLGYAMDYVVDSILFDGKYNLLQDSHRQSVVDFSRHGIVTGLENHKRYNVITDFVVYADNNLDQIYFDINTELQNVFTFEFHCDSLLLFQISSDTLGPILHKGELRYTLVRQTD